MRKNPQLLLSLIMSFCSVACRSEPFPAAPPPADTLLSTIKLPAGFQIAFYAKNVPGARSMTLSPSGILYVGTRDRGDVYAVIDSNADKKADRVVAIAHGLNMPNGVAYRNGALYVAEVDRVLRYDNIDNRLASPPDPVVVNDSFPSDQAHGWKFIRIGPDQKLYVPVGMPCNVCERQDQRYGSIMRMNLDGTGLEVFAKGVRNSVGFDWDSSTGELWFTDNGRDWLGDDRPPDELNHARTIGMHFGFPYCDGKNISDPDFGSKHPCSEFTPPAMELGPHVASLGMRFYRSTMFPAEYRKKIFIAEHGSWNRSVPIGYRVTTVMVDSNRAVDYKVFAEGWLQKGSPWGRPVDVQVMPDGALLVSDDLLGAIYRISYGH